MILLRTTKEWVEEYKKDRSRVWYIVEFDNKQQFFFYDYNQWFTVKEKVKTLGPIREIRLQFRSHIVKTGLDKCDGLYLVRSLIGRIGGDSTNTITIGKIIEGKVHKEIWSTPDLTMRSFNVDSFEKCFKKGMVIW